MKILYVVTKSNWGGAQRYVYDLAEAFSCRGETVSVATGGSGALIDKLRDKNIPVYIIPSLVRDINIVKEIKAFFELFNIIKQVKPDILHLNSSKAAGIGSFCGKLLGVKTIVVTLHGVPFREDRSWIVKKLLYIFTWLTCLLADKVITVSLQDEHDMGMMFTKNKLSTIHLGLPYGDLPERTVPKTRKTHIVTIAELHRNKGLVYAIEAIDNLHKEGLDITYSIFGEGEDRKKLEDLIAEKHLEGVVFLCGHVNDVADKIHDYDIFLLSSIKEGLPYVLLEAGRVSLPVVTSITGGIPEIVRHEETGLLVHPKDVKNLTKELKRLILDRKYAKKLGQSLREHVVLNFSSSKMLVETSKVYGLVSGKKK